LFNTHAVVLGASGSGKTVQCKTIIEEAILNDIPVIAIDPKGDIAALGINFPLLKAEDAIPFVKRRLQTRARMQLNSPPRL